MKDFLFFLRMLFKPTKVNNALGLQQKTIAISMWIIAVFISSAVVIEGINSGHHWLTFIENILVGIACSAFVVAVTVFLQFKAEQESSIKKHNSSVYQLLSCAKTCLFETAITHDEEQNLIDSLYEACDLYIDNGTGICWYNAKKLRKYFDVMISVGPLILPLLGNIPISTLAEYKKVVTPKMYDTAVGAAFDFATEFIPESGNNRFERLKRKITEGS